MLISVQVCILMCYTSNKPKMVHMDFEISDTMTISCPNITAIKNNDDYVLLLLKSFISGVLLLSPKATLAFMILPGTLSSLNGF